MMRSGPLILVLLVLATVAASTHADDVRRPTPRERLTLRFDFEDDADVALDPKATWQLTVGRRHCQNVRLGLDETQHVSGKRSLFIELDGVANVFETRGRYVYDPTFSYRLSCYLRTEGMPTEGLRATTAKVEVVGLTPDGKREVFSACTEGVTGTSDWQHIVLDIPRDLSCPFDRVKLRCLIDGIGIGGKVWFDAIELSPRPTFAVSAGRPDGYFSPGETAEASVAMHTLIDGDYQLVTKLTGPDGRESAGTLNVSPRLGCVADATVKLAFSDYGVYRLHLDLRQNGRSFATSERSLLYWPGTPAARMPRAWGVCVGSIYDLPPAKTDMLRVLGFGTVAFDLFSEDDPADNATADVARRSASQLGRLRQHMTEPVLVLGRVPAPIVNHLFKERQIPAARDATWLRTLSFDPKYWQKRVTDAVPPFASRVVYYQIGHVADPTVSPRELKRAVTQLRAALDPLTYELRIGVVFDGSETPEKIAAASTCDFIVLDFASRRGARWMLDDMVRYLRTSAKEIWVSLSAPPAAGDARQRAEALVTRMILARAAGADRVIVPSFNDGVTASDGSPTAVTAAVATLAREIGDRPPAGRLYTGARSFVFGDATDARMVVLGGRSGTRDAVHLGDRLRRIDLRGNARAVPVVDGKAMLAHAGGPYFVDGLGTQAVLTRLSLRAWADSPTGVLRSEVRRQKLNVELVNRYSTTMTGTVEVIPPEGWTASQPEQTLLLKPGVPGRFQTHLSVPITAAAGDHVLLFRLKIAGKEMIVARKVPVMPSGIDTSVAVRPDRDGGVTVTQKITNHGAAATRLVLFVVTADHGRLERFVNGLAPAASREVTFTLDNVRADQLWVGWRETSGPRFFNRYIPVATGDE